MKKIFAANWKLHKSPRETRAFFHIWKDQNPKFNNSEFVFFPSAISLEAASQELQSSPFQFGAQNCFYEDKGAFTGENSPSVIKELGGGWCLVGHSERRQLFSETENLLAPKIRRLQELDLVPLYCIGENLAERDAGQTLGVLADQLLKGLAQVNKQKTIVIAYEPVWAIGTGRVASANQVHEAHQFIRSELVKLGFRASVPLLYGGSVKADNAAELSGIENVNGFLVGGASLEVASFLAIAEAASKTG